MQTSQKWEEWDLPVPPGFTISTKVCDLFYKDKKKLNSKIVNTIKKELKVIEKEVKKKFGDLKNPYYYQSDLVLEYQCQV